MSGKSQAYIALAFLLGLVVGILSVTVTNLTPHHNDGHSHEVHSH